MYRIALPCDLTKAIAAYEIFGRNISKIVGDSLTICIYFYNGTFPEFRKMFFQQFPFCSGFSLHSLYSLPVITLIVHSFYFFRVMSAGTFNAFQSLAALSFRVPLELASLALKGDSFF